MSPTISLTIDGQVVATQPSQTVLGAAGQAGISIPHLCAYPDLEPFGGCRMCIVEIEGLRGYPTACTTPAAEGMVVLTRTAEVEALRRETLQLILSEHPSNCLFCEEALDCGAYMVTTRKGDVVTGCRSCPKDGQCELQEVIAEAGLAETNLPFHHRGLLVEKYDPFYDRDYNLCILCGRCVRVCQEVRLADVLTFKQRGPAALVGPAFERSHLDAGCEFCGDCVAACPTGALFEKTLKWAGKPEREVISTCLLCSLGCELKLQVRGDEVMGALPGDYYPPDALPGDDPLVNQRQLCVKGRFAAYELLNNPDRLRYPQRFRNGFSQKMSWEAAIDLAAEKLAACQPDQFAMLVSPDCTNEDLYVAQKFTREVMHSLRSLRSQNIVSRALDFYGHGFVPFAALLQNAGQLSDLKKATTILSIGLDGRYGWSVVAVELRKAVRRGARLVTFFPREHSLSSFAERWLPLDGPALAETLQALVRLTAGENSGETPAALNSINPDLALIARALVEADAPVIIVGPEYLADPSSSQILEAVALLARQVGAGVLPLAPQGNLAGALKMGELISPSLPHTPLPPDLHVLYLVGETPSPDDPAASFLIYQNFASYEGSRQPDLALPSAAFAEVDGTTINLEGRTRQVRKAVNPPGEALPDWLILCRIAQKMGTAGFDYTDAATIQREMAQTQKIHHGDIESTKEEFDKRNQSNLGVTESTEEDLDKIRVPIHRVMDAYKGFPLTTWVEGLRLLAPEN
jgi:predicted molibdopterin-dependent oxidoreductase YjgC